MKNIVKQNETKKILTEIIAELHTLPNSFPSRESDEYDLGYQEAVRDVRHLVKEYLVKSFDKTP